MTRLDDLNQQFERLQALRRWLNDHAELVNQTPATITLTILNPPIIGMGQGWPKLDVQLTGDVVGEPETCRAEMARWARAVQSTKKTTIPDYFILQGQIADCPLEIWAHRGSVCTRRVTGTHEVQEQVPTAFETRTKTVEDVEWDCAPILKAQVLE